MTFVHENLGEFSDLIQIIVAETGLSRSIVEKDYWVTHVLWSLSNTGLDVWFKGGTSLSKGFKLIDRFSEDLDLKIEPGKVQTISKISNWRSEGSKATGERRKYFQELLRFLEIPSCSVELDTINTDKSWRVGNYRVNYPGLFLSELPAEISGVVLLEIGSARVNPDVSQDLTSWIHEKIASTNRRKVFEDNRARGIRCVHPLVTLLEKLDAIHRRYSNFKTIPAKFVRHYEDCARLIQGLGRVPQLHGYKNVRELAGEMVAYRQIIMVPNQFDPSLMPRGEPRWDAIRLAHESINTMFWGPRLSVEKATKVIRDWIAKEFE